MSMLCYNYIRSQPVFRSVALAAIAMVVYSFGGCAAFLVIIGDMFERLTNGMLRATPHRVCLTDHPRESIIRFNAFAPDTIIRPLDVFVNSTAEGMPRPLYTPVKILQRTFLDWTPCFSQPWPGFSFPRIALPFRDRSKCPIKPSASRSMRVKFPR